MRKVFQTALLIGLFSMAVLSRSQTQNETTASEPNLVPQDFTVDDIPISIKLPFTLFVNGKPHPAGWHIHEGSTMWLGVPNRGMYILSVMPRAGEDFHKAGAIRNDVISFQDDGNRYEIRTSGPILGADRVWNLYVEHLPKMEMKGPLFGVDRLGHCTLQAANMRPV